MWNQFFAPATLKQKKSSQVYGLRGWVDVELKRSYKGGKGQGPVPPAAVHSEFIIALMVAGEP